MEILRPIIIMVVWCFLLFGATGGAVYFIEYLLKNKKKGNKNEKNI